MALWFHPDGNKALASWRESCNPPKEDQDLVTGVLRSVATGKAIPPYHVSDSSDDTVTIIEAREGLTVHVRLYTDVPDQFELVRILCMTTEPGNIEATDR
jgi:hypothetical protein